MLTRAFLLVAFSLAAAAQGYITTVAGTDEIIPDQGANPLLVPLAPYGTGAVDRAGNYYFVDAKSNKVLKLTPSGVLSTAAGNGLRQFSGDGGPAIKASLNYPYAIALDSRGNLFIADRFNFRVRRVDAQTGVITTIAGSGIDGPTSGDGGPALTAVLGRINGMAIDSANNIYLSDTSNRVIRVISAAGTIATFFGTGLLSPYGIAIDAANNLYIADDVRNQILEVIGGTLTVVAGSGQGGYSGDGPAISVSLGQPEGVAVDASGNIWIADVSNNRIRKVSGGMVTTVAGINNGLYGSFSGDGGSAIGAGLSFPTGVSVDSAGAMFILDSNNNRIRKVAGGIINTVAGTAAGSQIGDGGTAANAFLSTPVGVAADGRGNLFIADTGNHRIRRVAPDGTVTTYAGTGNPGFTGDGGPATSATLNNPFGVAVDSAGNVYIADTDNAAIRKIDTNQIISTIAGTGVQGLDQDGPALSTRLYAPRAVAIDRVGSVYVADTGNSRLRKVSFGQLVTIALVPNIEGVAVDANSNVYVADTGESAVYKIDQIGNITLILGNVILNSPTGVLIDPAGNVLIADRGNNVVRMVNNAGTMTVIAGSGLDGFSGDGGSPTRAQLSSLVSALAMDGANNLYIADTGNNRIRAILTSSPTFSAVPASLSFTANSGDAPTPFQTVNLSSIAGFGYTVQTSDPWIQATPSSGLMPAAMQVAVDPANLTVGSQQGQITISAPGAAPGSLQIAVSATINPGQPATLSVDTPGLRFGLVQGTGSTQQQFSVKNAGGGNFTFSATATMLPGTSGLGIVPSTDAVTSASPGSVIVTASPQGLSPGTYSGVIALISSAGAKNVPVTMTVAAAQPKILLSQSGLSFQVLQGGTSLPQSFAILNTGQGQLLWSATATTFSGGPGWLSLGAASGTVATSFTGVSSVDVSVSAAGLAPGRYYGQISVSAQGADNSPQIVSVVLVVLPPGSTLHPEVRPSSLVFSGSAGANPGSQDVMIGNPTGQSLTFTSSATPANSQTIVQYVPQTGTLPAGGTAKITVQPDFSKQTLGVNTSTLGIRFSDGSVQTVQIITVAGGGGGSSSSAAGARDQRIAACNAQLKLAPSDSNTTIATSPGQAVKISARVTDGCGATVNNRNLTVQATFTNGDKAPQSTLSGDGKWDTTYTPTGTAPATVGVLVNAFLVNPNSVVSSPPLKLSVAVQNQPGPAPPIVTDGGVANGASFAPRLSQVALGSYVSIFGQNLGDSAQPSGTRVTLGNRSLALTYVSDGQLNAQVPFDMGAVNNDLPVVVRRGDAASVPTPVSIAPADPAIFTANVSGSGQGSITNALTGVLADANTPVTAGDIVSIYCTGLGQVDVKLNAGDVSPSSPLAHTVNNPTVLIGGQPAEVQFSGLAPGFVGLYQINATVPAGVSPGPAPVVINIAGQTTSKIVTLVAR